MGWWINFTNICQPMLKLETHSISEQNKGRWQIMTFGHQIIKFGQASHRAM
jgi:hypothetical protein